MSCLMEGCTNTKRSCKNSSIVFFGFPNIPAMRAKWQWACNIKTLPKKPTVCSMHFAEKDILNRNDLPRLHRDAFPLPPEGSHRREIALGILHDNNVLFVKRSSGILIVDQKGMRLNAVGTKSTTDVCDTDVSSDSEQFATESLVFDDMMSDSDNKDFIMLEDNLQVADFEILNSDESHEHSKEECNGCINTASEDDETNVPLRVNQYFKCCVTGCTNSSNNSDIKFYKFRTDEFSRSRWCEKINMKESLVHSNTKICANHFIYPDDFKGDGNLKPYSVPSVNIPGGPEVIQHIMPVRTRKY